MHPNEEEVEVEEEERQEKKEMRPRALRESGLSANSASFGGGMGPRQEKAGGSRVRVKRTQVLPAMMLHARTFLREEDPTSLAAKLRGAGRGGGKRGRGMGTKARR